MLVLVFVLVLVLVLVFVFVLALALIAVFHGALSLLLRFAVGTARSGPLCDRLAAAFRRRSCKSL